MVIDTLNSPPTSSRAETAVLRLLLADDHEMVRLAMRYALASLSDSIVWREASNAGAGARNPRRRTRA